MNIDDLVDMLRSEGGDTGQVEAKRAAQRFPDNVAETLSAFSNTPGGGLIIFGLDEEAGFSASGVYDASTCQKAVTNLARHGLQPPILVTTTVEEFEGVHLVVVTVPEADRSAKPIRVLKRGRGYLRQYDGDYPLSDLEEQAFVAQRTQPRFDQEPILDADISDLDSRAVEQFLTERRLASPRLASLDDEELLRRTGVVTARCPSLAGLLSFGIYPQQFIPNLGIQASLHPDPGRPGVRVLESVFLGGSIPTMLDDACDWVQRVMGREIVADERTGMVMDRFAFPPLAVRELVANALIHRDLGPYAQSTPVVLDVSKSRFLIANEGGLFGLTVESLGRTPSHLRNPRLTEILQSVRTRDTSRVVERLGSGVPAVRAALQSAGLRPPVFIDQGIRFTAKILTGADSLVAGESNPSTAVLGALGSEGLSIRQIRVATGLTRRQVEYALGGLVDAGIVLRDHSDGRTWVYKVR